MKRLAFTIVLAAIAASMGAQLITRSYYNTPLPKALMELNDIQSEYIVSFIYDDLRDFTVTTSIEKATVQEAIGQMTRLYNIRTTTVGKTILVESGIQGNRLRGSVIDQKSRPVEYANISLLSVKDSTLITGGVSNEQGRFVIPCNEPEVIMRMTCIGLKTIYQRVKTGYIGTIRMQPDSYSLSSVTVKGDAYMRKEDRLIVIPNKLDVKHAYTGYDLLYNMMMPGMYVDRKAGTVQTANGEATLYINGVKSDYQDIKNLKPKEVIKIEYFEIPTGKYSGDVASINFIVKTYKTGGYVALDGTQTVGYMKGDYNVAAKLSHENTSYTLYAGHSMKEYDDNRNHETEDYHFEDYSLTRDNAISNAHTEQNSQYAQLKITNHKDKRTLQSKFSLLRSASPTNSVQSLLAYSDLYDSSSSSALSNSQAISPTFQLLGEFKPKEGHVFTISIDGSYSHNRYDRTYSAGAYTTLSDVSENIFSFFPQLKYTFPLKNKSSLTAQLLNFYHSSDANYRGTNESWQHLWSSETLFFLYYNWRISKKLLMENRGGFSYEVYRHHGSNKVANFSPRWNTYLSCNISKKHYVQAYVALGNSYPQISQLNSAEQSVDMLHVKRGNPNLDNAVLYDYGVGYNWRFGRFNLWCQMASSNVVNATTPSFNAEENRVVETFSSDNNYHGYRVTGDLTYRPTEALTLRIVGKYNMYRFSGQRKLSRDKFTASFYLNYYWNDFSLSLHGRTGKRNITEEAIVINEDPIYDASISWHHGNWYAEMGANNFFTRNNEKRRETISDVYRKTSYLFNRDNQRSAYIKIAYSFDFGKKIERSKTSIDKSINSAILKAE